MTCNCTGPIGDCPCIRRWDEWKELSIIPSTFSILSADDAVVIEQLAEVIHNAWVEEKKKDGIADHPWTDNTCQIFGHILCAERVYEGDDSDKYHCHKPQDEHHPDMIPYSGLSDRTKEHKRAIAHAILKALWPKSH